MSAFANADGSNPTSVHKRTNERTNEIETQCKNNKKIRICNTAWILNTTTTAAAAEVNLNSASGAEELNEKNPSRSDNNLLDGSEFVTTGEVASALESVKTSPFKDVCVTTNVPTISTELLEKASVGSKKTNEEIELVLLPVGDEGDKSEAATRISDSVTCIAKGTAGSSGIVTHHHQSAAISNSEITIGPMKTLHSTATVMNRVSVQSTMQSQPIMVNAKKFMSSDVMQTTAKVSIGNTTISVPLLKPLNSKQLQLPGGFTVDTQNKGTTMKYQATSTSSGHPKAQVNLSKILNIKRNQKGGVNQPTIVSLSQLQIKPVSNAKIVQAKVLGKKMPLQLQVTTTSLPNQLPTAITTDSLQKLSVAVTGPGAGPLLIDKCPPMKGALTLSASANVKKVICSGEPNSTPLPPLLTPLSKYSSELAVSGGPKTQTMSVCSSVGGLSIVKQNASQLITTTSLNTTICSTAIGSEPNVLVAKSSVPLVRNKPAGKLNAIIPKNISLMLTKSTSGQQPKMTTLVTSNSGDSTTAYSIISATPADSSGSGSGIKGSSLQALHAVSESGNISVAAVTQKDSTAAEFGAQSGATTTLTNETAIKIPSSGPQPHALLEHQPTTKRFKAMEDSEAAAAVLAIGAKRTNLKISSKLSGASGGGGDDSAQAGGDTEPVSSNSSTAAATAREADNKGSVQQVNSSSSLTTSGTTSKSEETHNVLLKQLLQNCSATPAGSQQTLASTAVTTETGGAICSQMLSNRKVINVRAPSLGLVSSLEAQLARPVIPPVTASTAAATTMQHRQQGEKQEKLLVLISSDGITTAASGNINSGSAGVNNGNKSNNSNNGSGGASASKENGSKVKSSTNIISKETSFVSNPNGKFGEAAASTLVGGQQQQEVTITEMHALPAGGSESSAEQLAKSFRSIDQQQPHGEEQREEGASGRCPASAKTTPKSTTLYNVGGAEQMPTTTLTTKSGVSIRIDAIPGRKEKAKSSLSEHMLATVNNCAEESVAPTPPANACVSTKLYRPVDVSGTATSNAGPLPEVAVVPPVKMAKHEAGTKQIIIIENKLQPGFDGAARSGFGQPSGTKLLHAPTAAAEVTNFTAPKTQFESGAQTTPRSNIATAATFQGNTATPDNKMPLSHSTPTTPVAAKDADQRKKRKREYQKQRRQMLNSNKELVQNATPPTGGPSGGGGGGGCAGGTGCVPNAKQRRARKCSKIEEDYDGFIDNLMVRMRQMPPLEVQEPLLNRNFAIATTSAHDRHNTNVVRSSVSVAHNIRDDGEASWSGCRNAALCTGEYGRVRHCDTTLAPPGLYDGGGGIAGRMTPQQQQLDGGAASVAAADKNQQSVIQNDFYDQEFVPVMCRNDGSGGGDRLAKFIGAVRERNVEVLSTVHEGRCVVRGHRKSLTCDAPMPYPGLILANKQTATRHEHLGRMSPIVEAITSNTVRRFRPLLSPPLGAAVGLRSGSALGKIKEESGGGGGGVEHHDNMLDCKASLLGKTAGCNLGGSGATVVVSLQLSSASADNVLGILRDLANLLHVSPFTDYKMLLEPGGGTAASSGKPFAGSSGDGSRAHQLRKERVFASLQQIVTGRRQMCSRCGDVIQSMGIRSLSATPDTTAHRNAPRLKALHRVAAHLRRTQGNGSRKSAAYFCTRTCYEQHKADHSADDDANSLMALDGRTPSAECTTLEAATAKSSSESSSSLKPTATLAPEHKCGFKYFCANSVRAQPAPKSTSDKELMDALLRMDITVTARNSLPRPKGQQISKAEEDTRQCALCGQRGDGLSDGVSRLLNFEVDKWVHLNCALWSNGVYETVSGGLMNLPTALQLGHNQTCYACRELGATVKCFKNRCGAVYHLPCAIKEQCVFYKNKTIQCAQHASRTEKENELGSLTVHRRVFVERDENCQVAAVMHHSEQSNLLRVGSLTFLNVGQLLPHQLEAFHTAHHIYPIGYKIIRLYWSMKRPNKRCRYMCSIAELAGRPEFRIQVQEPHECDVELRDSTPNGVWQRILTQIAVLRRQHDLVQLYPKFISGEDLFGLTEPTIVRIIESLPGIEHLTDYRFKYGRNPLLELPLAVNPSGSARTEPKQRQLLGWRKPHTQRTATTFNQRSANSSSASSSAIAGEVACPYSKQFVHSKSSQYKKMKQEWRNNVYLARSKIQGLGLYAARDIEKHTMIIEYIGEVIRTEVSEIREKQYEAKNRGIYMFRLDEDRVVDATLSGGLARYINHSCNPNCVTETVEVDRELRIIIFAKRRINRGEELSYDYKFDIEDDAHKIPCMCATPNCRKWMN